MRVIKTIIVSLFLLSPINSNAETSTECISKSGSSNSLAICYKVLSNNLTQENKTLINKIDATIQKANKNKNLLKQYERQVIDSMKFCQLSRNSATKWISQKYGTNPPYYVYDINYYKCKYNILIGENTFLQDILEYSSW